MKPKMFKLQIAAILGGMALLAGSANTALADDTGYPHFHMKGRVRTRDARGIEGACVKGRRLVPSVGIGLPGTPPGPPPCPVGEPILSPEPAKHCVIPPWPTARLTGPDGAFDIVFRIDRTASCVETLDRLPTLGHSSIVVTKEGYTFEPSTR